MEFLKFRDGPLKGPAEKRNKPDVVATTAEHPDSRRQNSRSTAGCNQGTCAVSHFGGKFTSGSHIRASRSDLLKLPSTSLKRGRKRKHF